MVRAAGGDVAFVHGLARAGAVGQFSMWLRVTFGLRKRDGVWQITYEHESVPFCMDDFRAADTALPPSATATRRRRSHLRVRDRPAAIFHPAGTFG